MFNLLTNAQLVRATYTTKEYIHLDTRYGTNHSAGKVTFSDNLPAARKAYDEGLIQVVSLDDITGLHGAIMDMLANINRVWMRECYHWESFTAFLKSSYGLTEWQFQEAKRWNER